MQVDKRNDVLDYYASHSSITDPGEYAGLLEGLPRDLESLCEIVRGLHMHYMEGSLYGITIPSARLQSDEARTISRMLPLICALDERSLTTSRPPDQRLVGCCRDFALMLCTLLRQQGVPARVRFGFGLYLNENGMNDHVVCEYWKADEQRWALVDAQQDEHHCKLNHLSFDPHDIPHDRFVLANDAWQQSRAGTTDPYRFGYDNELRGMWVVQQYLVHDFASLNKMELLIGDQWGLAQCGPEEPRSPQNDPLLDRVAALITAGDAAFHELRAVYEQHEELRVPSTITCYHLDNERSDNILVP